MERGSEEEMVGWNQYRNGKVERSATATADVCGTGFRNERRQQEEIIMKR